MVDAGEWLWNVLVCRHRRDQCKKNTYYWVLVVDLCVRADLLRMRAYALHVDVWMQININKKQKQKTKNKKNILKWRCGHGMTWHADVLAHGCVACFCGCRWWMGVWTRCVSVWMHCEQTDEEKKKKRNKPVRWGWWTWVCGSADALHVRTNAYEWKKEKKKNTY